MTWVRALVFLGHGQGLATATIGGYPAVPGGQLCNQHVVQGPLTHTPLFPLGPFGAAVPLFKRFAGCIWCQAISDRRSWPPNLPYQQMMALRSLSTVMEGHPTSMFIVCRAY